MTSAAAAVLLPTLESGDNLSQPEFHRRYELRPDLRAELVDGVVYVAAAAVRVPQHGRPHLILATWLGMYADEHPEVDGADNATWRRPDLDLEVQPDLCLWHLDGRAWIDDEGFIAGVPDLIIEIAASSASYDLHQKMQAYERAGVREYIAWRTEDRELDWFFLEDGRFLPGIPDDQGRIASRAFPGLRLNIPNLLAGKRGRALLL